MKHLRRFDEELNPGVYNRAAQGKEKIHGDVDAAKRLRDWAKTSEKGGKGYDIAYSCINPDKSQLIYKGIDYTAQMVKPTVRCVFFGSALSRKSYDELASNTMESVIEDWMGGNGPLSVSMVIDFETTETVDKTWTYEITISGRKIGENEDQFQTVTIDALDEGDARKKLVNMIKSSYPKIIGNPLESDVVKYKLVKGPLLGVDPKTSELMNKTNGVGWGSNKFGRWNKNLSTFVIEVRLSDSMHGLADRYSCNACGGAVTMDCYECEGDGAIWSDEADDNLTCTVCNGTGTHTCEECNGEDMTKDITKSKFLVDTFVPVVTMRPIPGKAPGDQSEVYSKYPWIGMFRTRDDAKRFLDNEWQRLINEDARTKWGKYGGVGGSLYEAVTDLVKEVMDVKNTKTVDYMEDAVSVIENISVGAMVDNRSSALASLNSIPRNISTRSKEECGALEFRPIKK
jgi:hypothetical protein